MTDVVPVLDAIDVADQRLVATLRGLTDAQVAAPSRLPGWTRGHVLAHLHGLGSAVARQLEAATEGRVVEFYDGGRPARDAAIEAGAGAAAHEHVARVTATVERVETALDDLTPEALDRPSGYRGRPTSQVLLAWWREVAVHTVDLDLGVRTASWEPPLLDHLVTFLAPRVLHGVEVSLEPLDAERGWRVGTGELVTVRGAAVDLVAWLAGRDPDGELTAERDGAPAALPDLGPWP